MISIIPLTKSNAQTACDDMPGEMQGAIVRKSTDLYEILSDGQAAGVALAVGGCEAFLSVCVYPEQRGRGLGMAAVQELEHKLHSDGAKSIMCSYPAAKSGSRLFSEKLGFRRRFSSEYMSYRGLHFSLSLAPLTIRPYCDADFDAAHALYAEAFHIMRQNTGDFPFSVPEPSSERIRLDWANTADERFVCIENETIVACSHICAPEIGSVAVAPAMQQQGVGRRFVPYLCNQILSAGHEAVTLFCVVGNPARHLYDSLGFQSICTDEFAEKDVGN